MGRRTNIVKKKTRQINGESSYAPIASLSKARMQAESLYTTIAHKKSPITAIMGLPHKKGE